MNIIVPSGGTLGGKTTIISFLLTAEKLNFSPSEIRQMGSLGPKVDLFIKLSFRFLVSDKLMANKTANFWKQHYSVGEMQIKKIQDKPTGLFIVDIIDFYSYFSHLGGEFTTLFFDNFLEGYIEKVIQLIHPQAIGKMNKITTSKLNDYEFTATW